MVRIRMVVVVVSCIFIFLPLFNTHSIGCCTRILTRGNHLRRDTYTVFALDDFEFDAPFGVPSLDCDRIAIDPMLDDPNDEWFANFSNWIPLPKWIPPYCDGIDRMDAPNVVSMKQKVQHVPNKQTKKKNEKQNEPFSYFSIYLQMCLSIQV